MRPFLRLILSNLTRHRLRTGVGILGLAFGFTVMFCVLSLLLGAVRMFSAILEDDSHVLVFERDVSDLFFSSVPEASLETLRADPAVAEARPLLFGLVSADDHPVVTCFGVSPQDPRLELERWIAGDPARFTAEARGIAFGERAAGFLEVEVGDEVQLGGSTYRVAGVVRTDNGFEDGGLFMPLALAQAHFHREGLLSAVAVRLHDPSAGEAFSASVKREHPGLVSVEHEAFKQGYSQFRLLQATAWGVGGCALLLGGLGVANTLLLSVFTRVRELAILRVAGFSSPQIAGIVMGESIVLALAGCLAGIGGGIALLKALAALPVFQGYLDGDVRPGILAAAAGVAVLSGLVGSFVPVAWVLQLRPVDALRHD